MSAAKRRKQLTREVEDAEAKRLEELKEERSVRKASVTSQTKPKRGGPR